MSSNQASGRITVTKFPSQDPVPEFLPEDFLAEESPNLDMKKYEDRLKTFNDEWKLAFITPQQMAKAGFYYVGKQDCVKCPFCTKQFDYWLPCQIPYDEHKKKSPECPFFINEQNYDVCGIFYSSLNMQSEVERNIFLDSIPIHKNMVKFEDRLKTFEKCQAKMKQDIHTLCGAGFFYKGDGKDDIMVCFCCNQGLKGWEDDDDPWIEHARWSPKCSFLLFRRGSSFVDVCGARNETPQEELPYLDTEDKTNIENKNVDLLKSSSTVTTNKMNPTSENLLCKICQTEEREVVFIPCGHVIACLQCAMQLDNCAVCRKQFVKIMRIYLS